MGLPAPKDAAANNTAPTNRPRPRGIFVVVDTGGNRVYLRRHPHLCRPAVAHELQAVCLQAEKYGIKTLPEGGEKG